MSNKKSNTYLLSKERENIFDDYYNLIERAKLQDIKQQRNNTPDYNSLINSLTILERNIDDLASKGLDKIYFNSINKLLIQVLTEWLDIFDRLVRQPIFITSFSYNILGLAVTISKSEKYSQIDIQKDIYFFFPSRKDKQKYLKEKGGDETENIYTLSEFYLHLDVLNHRKSEFNKPQKIFQYLADLKERIKHNISAFGPNENKAEYLPILSEEINNHTDKNIFPFLNFSQFKKIESVDLEDYRAEINKADIHSVIQDIRFTENELYEWDVTVTIKGNEFNSGQIGFLMWTISKALESIDHVNVSLEDWGNGSKRFNLKIWIKTLFAKEEVKQVLEKSRLAIESKYMDIPIQEAEKLAAEKTKTIRETDNLLSKEEAKEIHKLDVIKRRLEIQDKAADIALKKIQVIKGISELITTGILANDSDFQIMINDLLYIEKKDKKYIAGENIEFIEEREIKKDKPA